MPWAQLGDETYCRYLQTIFADSAQSLDQLIRKLTEKQVSIDGILAQALLDIVKCRTKVHAKLPEEQQQSYDGWEVQWPEDHPDILKGDQQKDICS